MGVYIKNVPMPNSCGECIKELMLNIVCDCNLDNMEDKKRLSNCPLEDADGTEEYIANLQETIKELVEELEKKDATPTIVEAKDSFFNSLKRGLEQAINGDVREITIIEAEGEDD